MTSARIPDDLAAYAIELEDLVRWLAIPYGPNDPIWPTIHPLTGEDMPYNRRLAATWQHVVRGDGPKVTQLTINNQGEISNG